MKNASGSFLHRALKDESGQVLPWMAMLMVLFLGMAGLTLDLGHAYVSLRELQASTDAATLAGAHAMAQPGATLTSVTAAVDAYSSQTGSANVNQNLPKASVISVKYDCVQYVTTNMGVPCTGALSANAIQVTQQATIPTMFIQVLPNAPKTLTLTAISSAAVNGAAPAQYNVAMVVDTTNSMSSTDNDPNCGNTRIFCALEGVQTMLNYLKPCATGATASSCTPYDSVSLFTFPPVQANTAKDDTTCPSSNPSIVPYMTPAQGATWTPVNYSTTTSTAGSYQITNYDSGWSSTNQPGGTLDTSDPLTIATGGGVGTGSGKSYHPCQGMQTPGGDGTYYAGAIYAAASSLVAQQAANPNSINALIILSDGDADSSKISSTGTPPADNPQYGSSLNQCQQAVDAAQYAAGLPNTTVYTIAYGSPSTGCASDVKCTNTKGCGANTPYNPNGTNITPCQTMQQMSTNWSTTQADFFTDATATGSGGCTSSVYPTLSLNKIFTALTAGFGKPRLIPNADYE